MRKIALVLLGILTLVLVACSPQPVDTTKETVVDEQGNTLVLLAGSEDTIPIYEFNQAAYEQALAQDKKIFLQWYATWCPSCRAEQKISQTYFNELTSEEVGDSDIVAFRVNYKDSDTSSDEEELAREFGVSSQTTKVYIVNGERVEKTPQHYVTQKQYEDAFALHFN